MQIMQSWAESLEVLKPKNLKLFLLVTLKSVAQTYKRMFTKFIGVVLGYLVFNVTMLSLLDYLKKPEFVDLPFKDGLLISIFLVFSISMLWFYFFMFLMVRPSVNPKNFGYINNYWRHFLYALLFLVPIFALVLLLAYLYFLLHYVFGTIGIILFDFLYSGFIISWMVFYMLFLLDSYGNFACFIYSMQRSFLMVLYNLPFCLIFMGIFYYKVLSALIRFIVITVGFNVHVVGIPAYILNFLATLSLVIPISILTTFYTKRLHEQISLYFEIKGQ